MNLLFQDSNFGENFQGLLGFVDADLEFSFIQSELKSSTREIIKLVGQPMYDAVYQDYTTPTDTERLTAFQYAIALNAYRKYAPSNDLKHGPNGRIMRHTDNEKSPFQWMIDRDNANQEKKYYQAVDDLLEIIKDETEFTQSDNYQKLNELIINKTEDFEDFIPIDSRLLLLKLQPGIRLVELQHLKPILGETLYTQAKTDISQLEQSMQINIKGMLAYYAFAWGLARLSVHLMPDAVVQKYMSDSSNTTSTKAPEKLELPLAIQSFKKDGLFYENELADQVQALQQVEEPEEVEEPTATPNISTNKFFSA
jgi:hypothetical protein